MSDEDDFMMSDAESYEFEFEDDDDVMDDDAEVNSPDDHEDDGSDNENSPESLYYNAKNIKQDDPQKAIEMYGTIVGLKERGDSPEELAAYQFKAIKQLIKIEYKLDQYDLFINDFKKLFQMNLKMLQRSYVEDSLSRILDSYIGLPSDLQLKFLDIFIANYTSNDRLSLKAYLRKTNFLIEDKQTTEAHELLQELFKKLDKMSEATKSSHLLELYSIEIQLYSDSNDIAKLKELYNKTLSIQSTIPHPKINAIIKECGGKMYMRDENFEQASIEFYESFKNYDEIGNQNKRIMILKYLIITSALSKNEINKFESQETKFFLKDEEILKYIKLIDSFEKLLHDEFTATLHDILELEKDDEFLIPHLKKIEKIFKLQTLIHYIKPYERLSISKLCERLNLDYEFIEDSFLQLLNNGQIENVKLDLIDGVIYSNICTTD